MGSVSKGGHPSRYASLFGKSYWWMPESYYREKARRDAKEGALPLLRSAFTRSHSDRDVDGETEASCCPMCGIDLETLASITSGSASGTGTGPAQ